MLAVACAAQPPDNHGGLYSHSAVSIWGSASRVIPSPDGKKAIVVRPPLNAEAEETHAVTVKANGREYKTKIGAWVNAEAAWSPDSKVFFVTYNDGGNIGTYHLKVFYVGKDGLDEIEPIPNGRGLFAPTCFDPERPNVAGIRWLGSDSSRLLIAVQVPPHSSCASMGTFRAFEIDLPDGSILSRYDQISAKKRFGNDIGGELRLADDGCVQTPQTCVPSGLKLHKSGARQ